MRLDDRRAAHRRRAASPRRSTPTHDGRRRRASRTCGRRRSSREVLGDEDGAWAAELLGVTPAGSFEHGTSTARLTRDPWPDEDEAARWTGLRAKLREARATRPQPGRDDKVVAAVERAGDRGAGRDRRAAGPARPGRRRACRGGAAARHPSRGRDDGDRLRRVSRDGVAGAPRGVLEDYGDVAEGLLALHAVTGEARWLEAAGRLLDTVLAEFADAEGAPARHRRRRHRRRAAGGAAAAGPDGQRVPLRARRPRPARSSPSPRSPGRRGTARRPSRRSAWPVPPAAARRGRSAGRSPWPRRWWTGRGRSRSPGRTATRCARRCTPWPWPSPAPGAVVTVGPPDAPGVPLLAGRHVTGGPPPVPRSSAGASCASCRRPIPEALAGQLR